MVEVSVTVPDRALLNGLSASFDAAVEGALDELGDLALRAKDRQLDVTYSRAIPKGKNGKPRWKRTGAWRRSQRVTRAKGRRSVAPRGKPEKYEPRLANLPRGADGVNRTNAAAQTSVEIITPQAGPVLEQGLKNRMGL